MDSPLTLPELLTVAEAASALRVSSTTVRKLIDTGKLPAARVGAQWRIRRSSLDEYLTHQLAAS